MKKYLVILMVLMALLVPSVAMAAYTGDLVPTMTANDAPSPVVISASANYPGNYPWNAFNDNDTDYWWTYENPPAGGHWIKVDFGSDNSKKVRQIALRPFSVSTGSYSINTFEFSGSYDDSNWTMIYSGTHANDDTNVSYQFNNDTSYRYYKLTIKDSYYWEGAVGAREIELMEEITSPLDAPNLTATPGNALVVLSWNAVSGAAGYNVKRSTTQGSGYVTIANSVSGTTYTDSPLTNGITYYYVVTAINASSESGNSNEVSATPQATPSGSNALLVVTMANGPDLEYDLSMTDVGAFISWYNSRSTGSGQPYYCLSKTPTAPYTSRTDYLIFDKIVCFKVNPY